MPNNSSTDGDKRAFFKNWCDNEIEVFVDRFSGLRIWSRRTPSSVYLVVRKLVTFSTGENHERKTQYL